MRLKESTSKQVAEKTGRYLDTEQNYLNTLKNMGYLNTFVLTLPEHKFSKEIGKIGKVIIS